ncbi:MAG: hypothetical protein OYH76_00585 [Defluviicoccus sp.]|nr:hypothetical protein [Defluviicoccus sp.]MDE0274360.1 hypothetical protein [Defluviicoccus sp.]
MKVTNDRGNDNLCLRLLEGEVSLALAYVRQSLDVDRDNGMIPDDVAIPDAAIATSVRLMRKDGPMEDRPARNPAAVIHDSVRLGAAARASER